MAVKIRGGGATKPTLKRNTKTTAAKPKATRPTAKRAKAAKPEPTRTNRSSKTDLPERQLQKILDNLTSAAELRTELFEAHREAVDASNRLILDAEEQGVPVHMIVDAGMIARQQFYKLLGDAQSGKLGNGKHGATRGRPGRKPNDPATAKQAPAPKRQIKRSTATKVKATPKRQIRRKG